MTVAVCFVTGATVKNFRGRVAAISVALGFAGLVEKSGETWWTKEGPSQATTKPRRKVTKKRMEESIRTKQSGNPGDCQFPPPIDIRPARGADRTWNRAKAFCFPPSPELLRIHLPSSLLPTNMSTAVSSNDPSAPVAAETDFTPSPPDPTNEIHPTAANVDPLADASPTATEPLSKKAQKKLAKAAYIAERKKERRAAEKERKKEKRREYAQKRDAGELDPDELERERERKRQKTEGGSGGRRATFGARVVVDLGFDAKMSENVRVRSRFGSWSWFGVGQTRD